MRRVGELLASSQILTVPSAELASTMPTSTTPMNYAKFDKIAADLNSDDEDIDDDTVSNMQRKSQLLAQHDAMFLLVGWINRACPKMADLALTKLVRYCAATDKVVQPDKKKRFEAISKLLGEVGAMEEADHDALLRLCHFVQRRVGDSKDAAERLAASRLLLLSMGALNTLGCCDAYEGGADAVAATLEKEGEGGALATRIEEFEFAKAIVRESPEPEGLDLDEAPNDKLDDIDGDAPSIEDITDGVTDGGVADKMFGGQLKKRLAAKADDEELDGEEEAAAMREALAAGRKETEERIRKLREEYRATPWYQNVLKSVGRHLGLCLLAYCGRLAYDHYYAAPGSNLSEDAAAYVNGLWK